MKIGLKGHGHDHLILDNFLLSKMLLTLLHPSTVIVSHQDVVLPHTTILNADVSN